LKKIKNFNLPFKKKTLEKQRKNSLQMEKIYLQEYPIQIRIFNALKKRGFS